MIPVLTVTDNLETIIREKLQEAEWAGTPEGTIREVSLPEVADMDELALPLAALIFENEGWRVSYDEDKHAMSFVKGKKR